MFPYSRLRSLVLLWPPRCRRISAPGIRPLLTGLLVGANTIAGGALTGASMHPAMRQCEDDEGDKVLLSTDNDLSTAIEHARSAGWKFQVLRLHMDESSAV